MAFESWKEEVIAADVQHQLPKALVYGQLGVINRNYEGDVQRAKSVRIVGVGEVSTFDVVHGQDMPSPQSVQDTSLEMTIDYDKGFCYSVDYLDEAQTKIDIMSELNIEATYGVADAIDQTIASCYVDASAANLIGSDAAPKTPNMTQGDASNVFNLLVDCATKLADSKVPRSMPKWIIVPPAFGGLLTKDAKLIGGAAPGVSTEGILNGMIGRYAGFTILESHNVPCVTAADGTKSKYKLLFGTSKAITYADQLSKIRFMEMEKQFGKKVDGEFVWGRKVVRPEYLGVMTCNFS